MTTTTTTECSFHGCHQDAIEAMGFCPVHSGRGVSGTCDKLPAMPEPPPANMRAIALRYLDRVMPLCLAVALFASGCADNAEGLDTPDADPAVQPTAKPDTQAAPTPQPDAMPAVTPDTLPAQQPDTTPVVTPDTRPAIQPDTLPAVDTKPICGAGYYWASTAGSGDIEPQVCVACISDQIPTPNYSTCAEFVKGNLCNLPSHEYQVYCAKSCNRCGSDAGT